MARIREKKPALLTCRDGAQVHAGRPWHQHEMINAAGHGCNRCSAGFRGKLGGAAFLGGHTSGFLRNAVKPNGVGRGRGAYYLKGRRQDDGATIR